MSPTSVARRAQLSLALLVGFYLLALACISVVAGATVWAVVASDGEGAVRAGLFGGVLTLAVLFGLAASLRSTKFHPVGKPLSLDEAPDLWRMVEESAQRVETRVPDEVWLNGVSDAALLERSRLLGLLPGRRYLVLGTPLLTVLSAGEIRAVIARELACHSTEHTRLGSLMGRSHWMITEVHRRFLEGRTTPVSLVFRAYARLLRRVQEPVIGYQEAQADLMAGRITGREVAQSAFRRGEAVATAWEFYWDAYVTTGLDHGLAPRRFFAGFPLVFAGRAEEIAGGREAAEPPNEYVLTPPPTTDERIAALNTLQDAPEVTDTGEGRELLSDFTHTAEETEAAIYPTSGQDVLDLADYTVEAYLRSQRRLTEAAYRAVARVTGDTPARMATVLDAAAAGEDVRDRLRQANFPEGGYFAIAVTAAHDSGALRFEHRWDGPMRFLRPDGSALDTDEFERSVAAIAEGSAEEAAQGRAELEKEGVDWSVATGGEQLDTSTAEILGGAGLVKLDGAKHDLVITDLGLILVRCRGFTIGKPAPRLIRLLKKTERAAELIERPDSVWLPFEELAGVEAKKRFVWYTATLNMQGGRTHTLRSVFSTEFLGDSQTVLRSILETDSDHGTMAAWIKGRQDEE